MGQAHPPSASPTPQESVPCWRLPRVRREHRPEGHAGSTSTAQGAPEHPQPHPNRGLDLHDGPLGHRETGFVAAAWIIGLITQTLLLAPSGSVQTDRAANVGRPDRSGADQIDVEHQATDLAVGGSNPSGAPFGVPPLSWRGEGTGGFW